MNEALPDLTHSETIYKGRVFSITVDEVRYADGRVVKMECVRHRGSVVLLPMTAPDLLQIPRERAFRGDAGKSRGCCHAKMLTKAGGPVQ